MAKATKATKGGSGAMKVAFIGASLAGLAAAYFFLGKKGKENQKHAKAWAIKMKADVIEKLETANEITEPVYHEIIDAVAKDYEKGKTASGTEIKVLAQDLKKHWKTISSEARAAKSKVMKDVAKVAAVAKKAKQ